MPANTGERIADVVVAGMGSWRFIIIQTMIVALWIAGNLWLLSHPFDAFPFILLNLLFSTQAAYASPLILMAANRQSARDHKRDDLEASEVEQLFSSHQLLLQINQQQLDILQLLQNGKGNEETKVCDDRQAENRSNSAIRRSSEDEGWQASQADEVGVPLASYLAQMPDHPLARETEKWITSLGKTPADVSWWEIYAGQLAPHTWKARISVKFAGSSSQHHDVFAYTDIEYLKGIDNGR
jgi:uncharacterized membrane protein